MIKKYVRGVFYIENTTKKVKMYSVDTMCTLAYNTDVKSTHYRRAERNERKSKRKSEKKSQKEKRTEKGKKSEKKAKEKARRKAKRKSEQKKANKKSDRLKKFERKNA